MYLISSMLGFSGMETTEFTYKCNKQQRKTKQNKKNIGMIYFFFTFTSTFTSGTLYTVIVIALFLHILWDAGLHPLIPNTAKQHLRVHANLHGTLKKKRTAMLLHSTRGHHRPPTESVSPDTKEPPNRHNTARFGTSDMQSYYHRVCTSIMCP